MAHGAFTIENAGTGDAFDLKPKEGVETPDDQAAVSGGVYGIVGGLKTLKDHGAFGKLDGDAKPKSRAEKRLYDEFIERIQQVARAGCVATPVHTRLALAALEQIRAEIVTRKGRWIVNRYLIVLAFWGLVGLAAGGLILAFATKGYGGVVMGAMAGAWCSAAAKRRDVTFDGIVDFLDRGYEPFIRMLFVAVIASAFALLLDLRLLEMTVAKVDLAGFVSDVRLAIALGFIAGFGERAIPERVVAATWGKA